MPDQAPSHDHPDDDLVTAAGQIITWQHAALTRPLAEVWRTADEYTAHLDCVLNDLNEVYRQRNTRASVAAIHHALDRVVQQATQAAIYTLAARQRAEESATVN